MENKKWKKGASKKQESEWKKCMSLWDINLSVFPSGTARISDLWTALCSLCYGDRRSRAYFHGLCLQAWWFSFCYLRIYSEFGDQPGESSLLVSIHLYTLLSLSLHLIWADSVSTFISWVIHNHVHTLSTISCLVSTNSILSLIQPTLTIGKGSFCSKPSRKKTQ